MRQRVAIVTGIPAPYREPVFRRLAESPGLDVKVFYAATGHDNVAWSGEGLLGGYDYEFLPNLTPARGRRWPIVGYANWTIQRRLDDFEPTVAIVYGYNQLVHWLTFRHCLRRRIPFALRSDSNALLDRSTTWRSRCRRALVHRLVEQASGFLCVGSANRDYWRAYGAPVEKLFDVPYAIDNERLNAIGAQRRPDPEGRVRFLVVSRLIPRKRVDLVVAAFNRIAPLGEATLTVVGDGPERAKLQAEQSADARRLTEWRGKRPYDDALTSYAQADVLLLPSAYEPWGLVINEAMAAGLPVLCDQRVGAARDLLCGKPGEHGGFAAPALDVPSMVEFLERCLERREELASWGSVAQRRVSQWSFERTVLGFQSAVDAMTSTRRPLRTIAEPPHPTLSLGGERVQRRTQPELASSREGSRA